MTSADKRAANRVNAKQSTGPRTAAGKARSRLNALRHGLAVHAAARPELATTVAALTDAIVGASPPTSAMRAAATQIAEATVDLLRVRAARLVLLERIARRWEAPPKTPGPRPPLERPARLKISMATRVKAILEGRRDELLQAELAQISAEMQYEAELAQHKRQQAQIHESKQQQAFHWDQLTKLDRYERRAVSRCDRAIKAFDGACAAQHAADEPFAAIWQNEPNAENTRP